jgi:microcystin-dependent protein
MGRRDYAGGAAPTTLTGPVTSVALVVPCVALTGWPDGVQGPFAVVLGRGTPKEEKILCDQILNGVELSVTQRGYDGTSAQDHSAGTTAEHVFTAIDADEANAHVNATQAHGVPVGSAIVGTGMAQTLSQKTLDFSPTGGKNVATNLPRSSSPEIDAALAVNASAIAQETADRIADVNAEEGARIAGDDARYTKAQVDSLLVAEQPTGAVTAFAGSAAPAGWILCDGRSVSKDTYPALFAVIGTTFGGDGLPNFQVPDLRGRDIIGGGAAKPLAGTGGADTHVIGATNLPPHVHTINHDHPNPTTSSDTHSHNLSTYTGSTGSTAGRAQEVSGGTSSTVTTASDSHTHTVDIPALTGDSGNGPGTSVPLETLDPYLVLNYIIRAR